VTTDSALARFIGEITPFYELAYSELKPGISGFPVPDLPVMAYAVRPESFGTRRLPVKVETTGTATLGMTVSDFRLDPGTSQRDRLPGGQMAGNSRLVPAGDHRFLIELVPPIPRHHPWSGGAAGVSSDVWAESLDGSRWFRGRVPDGPEAVPAG
jgi:hypothetical protein